MRGGTNTAISRFSFSVVSRYILPMTYQTIGLFGGSFDPAHAGHVDLTRTALTRFKLDRVWWLVSPGNPLKSRQPAALVDRVARAQRIMDHPRVTITDIEARLGTTYTADTIRRLSDLNPQVRFVWLMGADNLAQFHHWKDWQSIMENVSVGVLARPGSRLDALTSPTVRTYAARRLPAFASHLLGCTAEPKWCYVNMPLNPMSSTLLRAGT